MIQAVPDAPTLLKGSIEDSTHVTFPQQAVTGTSAILAVVQLVNGKIALILRETPFHPVDSTWPDHPADRGTLTLTESDKSLATEDCRVLAVRKETQEVKEGSPPIQEEKLWTLVAAHVIDPTALSNFGLLPNLLVGCEVEARVDQAYRNSLSAHHTACHLAAVALNIATKHFWKKEAKKQDSLGSPNLDRLTIHSSRICQDRAEDTYRFGSSIRRKGLDVLEVLGNLEAIQSTVNDLLSKWIATGVNVQVITSGPRLSDTRTWHCELPEGLVETPCGGSHVPDLSVFSAVRYTLQAQDVGEDKGLLATTTAILRV